MLTGTAGEKREMQKRKSEAERENEEGMKGRRVARVKMTSNAMKMSLSSVEKFHMRLTRSFFSLIGCCSLSLTMVSDVLFFSTGSDSRGREEEEEEEVNRFVLSVSLSSLSFNKSASRVAFYSTPCLCVHLFFFVLLPAAAFVYMCMYYIYFLMNFGKMQFL